jgi:hypothetical protein
METVTDVPPPSAQRKSSGNRMGAIGCGGGKERGAAPSIPFATSAIDQGGWDRSADFDTRSFERLRLSTTPVRLGSPRYSCITPTLTVHACPHCSLGSRIGEVGAMDSISGRSVVANPPFSPMGRRVSVFDGAGYHRAVDQSHTSGRRLPRPPHCKMENTQRFRFEGSSPLTTALVSLARLLGATGPPQTSALLALSPSPVKPPLLRVLETAESESSRGPFVQVV